MEDRRGRRFIEQLQERPQKAVSTPAAGRQDVELGFCAQLLTQGTLPTQASPGLHVGRGPRDSAAGPAIPSGPEGRRRAISPLSVQKKGEQRSSSTQEWSPRALALPSPQGAPRPMSQGPRTHKP